MVSRASGRFEPSSIEKYGIRRTRVAVGGDPDLQAVIDGSRRIPAPRNGAGRRMSDRGILLMRKGVLLVHFREIGAPVKIPSIGFLVFAGLDHFTETAYRENEGG